MTKFEQESWHRQVWGSLMKPFPIICVFVVLLTASSALAGSPWQAEFPPLMQEQVAERNIIKIGDEAPNFHLQDLHGNMMSLSQFRGKVVLLNFWATWCGPCRIEMPAMEHLYQTLSRQDFEILAVSTDPQGMAVTRPFQREMGFTFPILHDPDMRIGLTYGARTLPLTFMVDRRGVIRKKIFGARDWDSQEARDLIHMLMKS